MKILLVSDQESPYIWDYFDKSKFQDIDLVISCGDLKPQYLSFLVTMIPVPLLYIHGNHDTKYLTTPPEGCICIEDTVYTYKDIKIGGLGGSMEYAGGPFQFTEKAMAKRVKKFIKTANKKSGLDILVTHSPSYELGDGEDLCHRGFECFYQIYDQLNPTYHFHGHQHLNYTSKPQRVLHHNGVEIVNGFNYVILDYKK